ncbi:MAG TPA: diphosphomevalonate decarboxylase [Anaerolineales bacterium]|nr:diphosphomevalonate decarboxylase [Anaerolineales bacterium]
MQTTSHSATAIANPNLAFIKYWGNRDNLLRIPANGSISMNLAGLETKTHVRFDASLPADALTLNGKPATDVALARAKKMLDRVREMAGISAPADVMSENNFPTGTGIASSASAFAALAVASASAAGLALDEADLSRLARTGSGSACRSVPGGFVEWQAGSNHMDSFAFTIASPEYWTLVDCVTIISTEHKPTGSTEGHALADTSPLQAARLADASRRLDICRRAIRTRDFATFADIVELDSNMMHSVMMTSNPRLMYWQPASLAVMDAVQRWRAEGLPVCFTLDAGPNVHVLCEVAYQPQIEARLMELPGVLKVLSATPGGSARLI